MKKTLYIFLFFILAGFALFLLSPSISQSDKFSRPWEVVVHKDKTITIFKVRLTKTTLAEVESIFGNKYQLAYIESLDKKRAVEIFYPDVKLSGITGKLTLSAQTDYVHPDIGVELKTTRMDNGNLFLGLQELGAFANLPVKSVAFVPGKNLSEKIILDTFGSNYIKMFEPYSDVEHYLFKDIGVDVVVNPLGKDAIQYVTLNDFQKIIDPLKKARATADKVP